MLCRFPLFFVVLSVVAFWGASFAVDVPLDSVMHLFVQDYMEPKLVPDDSAFENSQKNSDFGESAPIAVQQEYKKSEALRTAMESALVEGRIEDFKKIVSEVETFEKSAKFVHLFLNRDNILIRYFAKDFDFICNLDSMEQLNIEHFYTNFNHFLYDELKSRIATGELEKSLDEIEDASDRAFIYILLHAFIESNEEVSFLIEKYKYQLKKKEQLRYLVRKYWSKIDYDLDYYRALSMGASISTFLGKISDTTGIGFGGLLAFDMIRKNLFFEWVATFQSNSIKGKDSLWIDDMNFFDFNFGYKFLKKKYVHLYGFLNTGIGIADLACFDDSDGMRTCSNSPHQVYPIYGAGVVLDLFFTDVSENHMGLRFRGGVKNIWADKIVKSSGFRLYASIEWSILNYKKKNFAFEYAGDPPK